MPRIFWSIKRKAKLLKQARTMTVKQMAKNHLQPVAEIERMLRQLSPDNPLIKEITFQGKIKLTVYYPGYADGVRHQQLCGSQHPVY